MIINYIFKNIIKKVINISQKTNNESFPLNVELIPTYLAKHQAIFPTRTFIYFYGINFCADFCT